MGWVIFCKKKWKMKVFFGKKWKIGGCFFVKKVYLSSTQGALFTVSVFFVSHFIYFGGVRTQRTPCLRA